MDILKDLENHINQSIERFKSQLAGIRGSRPTPKIVEDIQVDYFGQKLTIKQLGSISVIPPREIQIAVWDKQSITNVAKAIESSNLNLSANIEGNLIKISLPPLSQERREELIKAVKKETEETRIKIRSLRDEINKKIVHQLEIKEINEDDKFRLKEKVQKLVDEKNKDIDNLLENKIKEIQE